MKELDRRKVILGFAALLATGFVGAGFTSEAHAQNVPPTQQVGQPCVRQGDIRTAESSVPTQGAMECIPDINGNYYWQAMGAGGARYDNTGSCNSAGILRWNGSAIQFCDGSSWQNIGGGQTLVVGGCQTGWSGCPGGYHPTSYFSPGTYNCCDRCGNPSWKYTVCSQ